MTTKSPETEIFIRSAFQELVKSLGTTVIEGVFDHAFAAWEAGREGVTLSDETETKTISIYSDRMVNFKLGAIGPFKLPMDEAENIVLAEIKAQDTRR